MPTSRLPQDRPWLLEGQHRSPIRVRLSIVDVLREAWRLYTSFLGRFFLIAVIVFGILSLVQFATDETREFGPLVVLIIATIVGIFWLQGAIVIAVDDAQRPGPSLSILEIFRRVLPRLWPLVGAGIVVATGVTAGIVLLVLPGLALLTLWSMVAPAIVLEQKSVHDALRRSWQLVKPDAFRVFAVIVITIVLATIVSTIIRAVLQPLPDSVDSYVATVIADAVSVPFVALAWTVMYFELKINSEPFEANAVSR